MLRRFVLERRSEGISSLPRPVAAPDETVFDHHRHARYVAGADHGKLVVDGLAGEQVAPARTTAPRAPARAANRPEEWSTPALSRPQEAIYSPSAECRGDGPSDTATR